MRLWGGNLSVLVSLLGTPYWPQVPGGMLFLEDVNEHPYRIERMLTQLLHAGVLARQKAVLLGQFTGTGWRRTTRATSCHRGRLAAQPDQGAGAHRACRYGHVPTKVLLPVGGKVDLLVEGRDAVMPAGRSPVNKAPRRSSSWRARASPCCSAKAAISSLRAYQRACTSSAKRN
jgi:muramoyltetrapeptide carboxypeptidase